MKGAKIKKVGLPRLINNNYWFGISVGGGRVFEDLKGDCYGVISVSLYSIGAFGNIDHKAIIAETSIVLLTKTKLNTAVLEVTNEFISELK